MEQIYRVVHSSHFPLRFSTITGVWKGTVSFGVVRGAVASYTLGSCSLHDTQTRRKPTKGAALFDKYARSQVIRQDPTVLHFLRCKLSLPSSWQEEGKGGRCNFAESFRIFESRFSQLAKKKRSRLLGQSVLPLLSGSQDLRGNERVILLRSLPDARKEQLNKIAVVVDSSLHPRPLCSSAVLTITPLPPFAPTSQWPAFPQRLCPR